jgi:hypothetical protein
MQSWTDSGSRPSTVIFTAPMPGWYELRVRGSRSGAPDGPGVEIDLLRNGSPLRLADSFASGHLPIGRRLCSLLLVAGSRRDEAYATGQVYLEGGDEVSFCVECSAPDTVWTAAFWGSRLGDDI